MANVSVGAAVGSGFRLIREQPVAVLTWGALQAGAFAVFLLPYALLMNNLGTAAFEPGAQPDRRAAMNMVGSMFLSEGLIFLAGILMSVVQCMIVTAVWRAVLHPEQRRWAYVRLGRAELFFFLFLMCLSIGLQLVMLPVFPFMFIVVGLVVAQQWVAAIVAGVLLFAAMMAAICYVEVRLALAGPMIVEDGHFHFVDAWRLTRGHVGRLLLVGLSLAGMFIGLEAVVMLIGLGFWWAQLGGPPWEAGRLMAYVQQQTPARMVSMVLPFEAAGAVLGIPIFGAVSAIGAAPWATAYRDLKTDTAAATFA
jgi:hypothetical protein